ncbi:MAG: polyprenyl synthetase family protein [Thermoplasmata archaeon]
MSFPEEYKGRVKQINEYLMRSLEVIENGTLRAAMAHYPSAGGKRLRPLLTTIACEAVGGEVRRALPFGVALEMVHNFTLVHDDVMDEDETRRGIRTVHAQWGVPEAILAGDALFARAFELMPETRVKGEDALRLTQLLASSVRLLAEGQQMDMEFEDAKNVSARDYMRMIELKTSVLYSAAAKGGVIIGGGTKKQEEALFEYGRLVGLGFQIWDDVLDLRSDQETFGKPVLNDIRNGKKTLIVINALEDLEGSDRAEFLRILGNRKATKRELERAREILEEVGAVDHAVSVANKLVGDAKAKLSALRTSPHKHALEQFADYAVTRKT